MSLRYWTSTNPSTSRPDGKNTVTFRRVLGATWVAAACLWIDDVNRNGSWDAGEAIVEFEIIFNRVYKWRIDPDDEGPLLAKGNYYFDVENVATHEAGHVVGLADLYATYNSEKTMYGYVSYKETKKISLDATDIVGAQLLWGAPTPTP